MREGSGPSSYQFRAGAPTWTRIFLERVAEALARAPDGHAVLVEASAGPPGLWVTCGRPEFAGAVRAAALSVPGALSSVGWVPRSAAPWDRRTPLAFVVARRGDEVVERPNEDRARAPRLPSALPTLAPALSVQSHWFPDGSGRVRAWTRLADDTGRPTTAALLAGAAAMGRRVEESGGTATAVHLGRFGYRGVAEWREGALRALRASPPLLLSPSAAAALVPGGVEPERPEDVLARHTVVLGTTGSGKTAHLVRLVTDRIHRGTPVLLFDLHGDLAPWVAGQLSRADRARLWAVDAAGPADRIPGLAVLGPGGSEAEAADVVAALKRLSHESGEMYWGFRLERIFDTFVRIVQDEGGSLLDLAALLTDERRREAARLTVRRPEARRFLEELPALLRRSPEFLWPAASRLSKIALVPALGRLLAPRGPGLPLEAWLARGGSVAWRLPFGQLGPEGASLAGTLLATRAYLAAVRSDARQGQRLRVLFVFDEAHAFSPRLLTELLADGRKFGVGVVIASQYPERLDPELRAAAAGAAGTHVVFRVPAAAARTLGSWVGLSAEVAEELLPALPVGQALERSGGGALQLRTTDGPPLSAPGAWPEAVDRTSVEFAELEEGIDGGDPEGVDEAILFELVAGARNGPSPSEEVVVAALADRSTDPVPAAVARSGLARLTARGWVERVEGRFRLTDAGERRLGLNAPSGAVSESTEHRALLAEAARILARRGLRLEIVRQGRFDTRLPDGLVDIAPRPAPDLAPGLLWRSLEVRRSEWGWRFFGGRHVHVEAEVSGAERRERILRGLEKALRRGAYALFLVADDRRARRVRAVLLDRGVYPGGGHLVSDAVAMAREKVHRCAVALEWLEQDRPGSVQSRPHAKGMAIPVPPRADTA